MSVFLLISIAWIECAARAVFVARVVFLLITCGGGVNRADSECGVKFAARTESG